MWLLNQRNSRHGAGFGYNLDNFDLDFYYKRYCEALIPIDDAVGRTMKHLEKNGELDNTIFLYMADNGFQFGDHGLIDKRTAYEASMRVPMIIRYPQSFKGGTVIEDVVANIDVAPTLLEAAGLEKPEQMHGDSFWKILHGEKIPWREVLLYEYFWECNYPHTPTTHAVRGKRYKFIRYHGIWDTDELYDIIDDPEEKHNLINKPEHKERIKKMRDQIFEILHSTDGKSVPMLEDRGRQFYNRDIKGSKQGEFPEYFFDKMEPVKK
ncbi:MAG: sulfatase-like hydrolase/transferase [Lentisphaerales bacterium]|nr:sulfatase-like hydrolase/transferase [Lentisphaerales bacterium]